LIFAVDFCRQARYRWEVMHLRAILLTVCFGTISIAATAAERITWLHPEFPPSYIASGELEGLGYIDLQLTVLQALLPEFAQDVVTAPLTRIWHELPRVDGLCFLGASKTEERLKLGLFSRRGILTPIIQLAMRAEQGERMRPYLDADGEVDLEKLKSASGLTGAFTATATYGQLIDAFIHAHDRTVTLNSYVELRQPFTLLERGRTDFIFVWPEQLTYFKRATHADFATVSFRVAGTTAAQPYYVACSNGPQGRKVIGRINQVLDQPEAWHMFVAPLRKWFPQADADRADRGEE
jgi:uncharacterized protein (TIGR02285 family)